MPLPRADPLVRHIPLVFENKRDLAPFLRFSLWSRKTKTEVTTNRPKNEEKSWQTEIAKNRKFLLPPGFDALERESPNNRHYPMKKTTKSTEPKNSKKAPAPSKKAAPAKKVAAPKAPAKSKKEAKKEGEKMADAILKKGGKKPSPKKSTPSPKKKAAPKAPEVPAPVPAPAPPAPQAKSFKAGDSVIMDGATLHQVLSGPDEAGNYIIQGPEGPWLIGIDRIALAPAALKVPAPAPEKRKRYESKTDPTSNYHNCVRSTCEKPIATVRRICGEMAGKERKEILAACIKAGVNPSTAATQYSLWKVSTK